jgi:predicted phage tail protein
MNGKLVNVYLEGKLGQLFGREWRLAVKSPGEAFRAININLKGKLKEYLVNQGAKKYYKIAIQKKDNLISPKEEINNPSGEGDIYFIPTIRGKSTGLGKIIAGAVLVIIGAVLFVTGWGSVFSAPLISAGVGLMIGGVVQLMTPIPKMGLQESQSYDQRSSSIFQGNSTTITQGSAVGIVYGRALVPPMPISMSMRNESILEGGRSLGAIEYSVYYSGLLVEYNNRNKPITSGYFQNGHFGSVTYSNPSPVNTSYSNGHFGVRNQ